MITLENPVFFFIFAVLAQVGHILPISLLNFYFNNKKLAQKGQHLYWKREKEDYGRLANCSTDKIPSLSLFNIGQCANSDECALKQKF